MLHKYNMDLVNWQQIREVVHMVEQGIMKKGELEFGPLAITIYAIPGQNTLRIDFRTKEEI